MISHPFRRESTARTVAGSGPPSVLEFISAGNCARANFLPLPRRKRIIKRAANCAREDSDASRETHGCRDSEAIDECKGLEAGKREAAPGVRMQRFRGSVWKNDPGGAGCRVAEPSSGMVQRVEQGGDRSEHAQRSGDQRAGFSTC